MARYIGPKGKIVRHFGMNLFESPKYNRLLERRNKPPGQHGDKQYYKKKSDYALQLEEKQKVRHIYGLLEKQFRRTFDKAVKQKGVTGSNLLILLERRLDNAVFRAGFAETRMQARQMVNHKHFLVNGRRVNIPSHRIKTNDVISIAKREKSQKLLTRIMEENTIFSYPEWLSVDKEEKRFTITRMPIRDDITKDIKEHLIVELYSK